MTSRNCGFSGCYTSPSGKTHIHQIVTHQFKENPNTLRQWSSLAYPSQASVHPTQALQNHTTALLSLLHLKRCPGGCFKHLSDAIFRLGRALKVCVGVDLVGHGAPLLWSNRLLLHLHQFAFCILVVAQILLVSDQNDGNVGAEVLHFWRPFLRDVLKTVRTVDGEAHEDDVCVRVGERPQSVVVLLSRRVPQSQLHLHTTNEKFLKNIPENFIVNLK